MYRKANCFSVIDKTKARKYKYLSPNSPQVRQAAKEKRKNKKSPITCLFNRVFKGGNAKRSKSLWIFIALISAFICVQQLSDRITHFLDHPIVSEINIKRVGTSTFPPIAICKTNFRNIFFDNMKEKILWKCRRMRDCDRSKWLWYNLSFLELDLMDLWEDNSVQMNHIKTTMSCAGLYDKSICSDKKKRLDIFKYYTNTYHGQCAVYVSTDLIEYQGASTYWTFSVGYHDNKTRDIDPRLEDDSDISLYVQRTGLVMVNSHIFYFSRKLAKTERTNIYISSKTFEYLNTTEQLCYSELTVLQCKEDCFALKLQQRNLTCKLPFLNLELPLCNTYDEAINTYQAIFKTYLEQKSDDCRCGRICNETKRLDSVDVVPTVIKTNRTDFVLYFSDGMSQTIREKHLYVFSALLSDIVGNLGFFLGLSLLTLLEFATKLVIHIYNHYKFA